MFAEILLVSLPVAALLGSSLSVFLVLEVLDVSFGVGGTDSLMLDEERLFFPRVILLVDFLLLTLTAELMRSIGFCSGFLFFGSMAVCLSRFWVAFLLGS